MIRNRSLAFAAFLLGAPACEGGSESPLGQGGTSNTGGSTSGSGGSGAGRPSGAAGGGAGASGNGTTGGSSGAVGDAGAGLGGSTGGTTGGGAGRGGTAGKVSGGAGGVGGTTSGGTTSVGVGGTTSGGQAGQGGTSGQPCGTVDDGGTPISETARTGPMPAPMGGTVSDGTYQLSAWDVYSPASADSDLHSATLRIALGMFELVVDGSTRQSGSVDGGSHLDFHAELSRSVADHEAVLRERDDALALHRERKPRRDFHTPVTSSITRAEVWKRSVFAFSL